QILLPVSGPRARQRAVPVTGQLRGRAGVRVDPAQRAAPPRATHVFESSLAVPVAWPCAGQLPGDPRVLDHGQEVSAAPGGVLGEAARQIQRPPDVVPGVLVRLIEMQQIY